MSSNNVNIVSTQVPVDRVSEGDLAVQWTEGPDGRPQKLALTVIRDGGRADQADDIEFVFLLEVEKVDVLIAMLQGARRHVELERARERARQGN